MSNDSLIATAATKEGTMSQHIYRITYVHPVECQPQWYNKDCEHAPLYSRYAPHIGIAIVVSSAFAFVLFALVLVGAL